MKQAVIFDLDGVICNTDEYHYRAWKQLADELNIPFDQTVNRLLRGISRMDSLEIILRNDRMHTYSKEQKQAFAEQKNNTYRSLLDELTPEALLPGVTDVLNELKRLGIRTAIGSSSRNTKRILEKIGLAHSFDAVADGCMITHSKPHPEVFLRAAELLQADPAETIVVEDAVAGAEAGKRGGFLTACVGDAGLRYAGYWNLADIREVIPLSQS